MKNLTFIRFKPEAVQALGLPQSEFFCESFPGKLLGDALSAAMGFHTEHKCSVDESAISREKCHAFTVELKARVPPKDLANPEGQEIIIFSGEVLLFPYPGIPDPTSKPVEKIIEVGEDPSTLSIGTMPLGTIKKVPKDT